MKGTGVKDRNNLLGCGARVTRIKPRVRCSRLKQYFSSQHIFGVSDVFLLTFIRENLPRRSSVNKKDCKGKAVRFDL